MPPRKHPMRRSKPKELVAQYVPEREERVFASGVDIDKVHYGVYARSQAEPVMVPKALTFRSETYRRLVAGMACARCYRPPPSQHCHLDFSKGMGIKTDDRLGWPGCPSCHSWAGSSGALNKAARRRAEAILVLQTIDRIVNSGAWPASVPRLDDARIKELELWAK